MCAIKLRELLELCADKTNVFNIYPPIWEGGEAFKDNLDPLCVLIPSAHTGYEKIDILPLSDFLHIMFRYSGPGFSHEITARVGTWDTEMGVYYFDKKLDKKNYRSLINTCYTYSNVLHYKIELEKFYTVNNEISFNILKQEGE